MEMYAVVVPLLVGSSTGLLVLGLLFYVEERRGVRFAGRVRGFLDGVVDWCIVRWHTLLLYVGGGAGRVGFHFLVHHVLSVARAGSRWLEQQLVRLQRRNRRIVRSVQAARTESHLTAIKAHKHATALSEQEKQDLRDRTLQGR